MFKIYDYICGCGLKVEDHLGEPDEVVICEKCEKPMTRLFPCTRGGEIRGRFQPFWSDTMQIHIRDREDLKKLKEYRKANNLICVGHEHQKPDRKAIRWNYEHD